MLDTLKLGRDDHVVGFGSVHCPRLGRDVSVETCWMCQYMRDVRVTDGIETVRCGAERSLPESIQAI